MNKPLLYSAPWCPYCVALEKKLQAMDVDYDYKNVDEPGVREEMNAKTDNNQTIPVMFVGNSYKINPNDSEVKELLMTQDTNKEATEMHDVIMIGAGPTSLAAAVYTSREDIETLIFEKGIIGGLAAITDMVDNYPGFEEGVAGMDLADKLQKQAERFGAKIELGEVQSVKKQEDGSFTLQTTSGEMNTKTVLIGTGSEWKKIGVPGESEFYGRGVHNCATCDGAFYRDKKLVVVGGGNSSAQEALFLTKFASHIDIMIRSDKWKASEVLIHDVEKNDKITVHFNTTVDEIVGGDVDGMNKVTGVKATKEGTKTDIETDGIFVFIGLKPVTYFLEGSGVEMDEYGFVKTNSKLMTAVDGIFCAGDVRSGATMQIASAVGEGASAALSIREYLENYDRERAQATGK